MKDFSNQCKAVMQIVVKLETLFFTFAPQHDRLQGGANTLRTQTRKSWFSWGSSQSTEFADVAGPGVN